MVPFLLVQRTEPHQGTTYLREHKQRGVTNATNIFLVKINKAWPAQYLKNRVYKILIVLFFLGTRGCWEKPAFGVDPRYFSWQAYHVKPRGKEGPAEAECDMPCLGCCRVHDTTYHHDATRLSFKTHTRHLQRNLCSRDGRHTQGWRSAALESHYYLRAVFPHPKAANASARRNTLHVLSAGTFHGSALRPPRAAGPCGRRGVSRRVFF